MISFVGAGPGAPDLITLRGAARLASAQVVVWASSLVPDAVLTHAHPAAVIHDSASMTLEDVLGVYAAADPDARIVRLHSGDPSLYGAIDEQIGWCLSNRRSWEIVPGVSALAAAAAAAGPKLTVPGVSQSVVLTRLGGRTGSSMSSRESVAALAEHRVTMAVFLSAARPAELQHELAAGYPDETPAVIVIRASWPDERVIRTTVGDLARELARSGATMTALVLVGEAFGDAPSRRSHLYAPDYAHSYRRRSLLGSTIGRATRRRPR
ncbi:MAG: precorrin-4 C(11)-methyltransferase [Acidimicrobiales bacterium]